MSLGRRPIVLGLTAILVTGSPSLAHAQPQSYDASAVQARIDRSGHLQQEALAGLNDPVRAEQLIREAYRELQAAHSAMLVNASGLKFPDPLLDLNSQKASEALLLMQRAEDLLKINRTTPSSEPSPDEVRRSLERSLRLTRLVLAL